MRGSGSMMESKRMRTEVRYSATKALLMAKSYTRPLASRTSRVTPLRLGGQRGKPSLTNAELSVHFVESGYTLEWLKSSKKGKKQASATSRLTGAFLVELWKGVTISCALAWMAQRPSIISARGLKHFFIIFFIVSGLYGFCNCVYNKFLRDVGQRILMQQLLHLLLEIQGAA